MPHPSSAPPAAAAVADLRRYERYAFRLAATLCAEDREVRTETRTMGLGGAFIACNPVIAAGTPVTVRIVLSCHGDGDEVTLTGQVAYAETDGVGVSFDPPEPAAYAALRGFFLDNHLHGFNTLAH